MSTALFHVNILLFFIIFLKRQKYNFLIFYNKENLSFTVKNLENFFFFFKAKTFRIGQVFNHLLNPELKKK